MKIQHFLVSFGCLATLTTLATVGMTVDWSTDLPWHFLLTLTMWPAAPVAASTLLGWCLRESRGAVIASLAGLFVVFGSLAFFYVYAFHINPDPQGGLILLFGPIYSSIGLFPFAVIALILHSRRPLPPPLAPKA